VEGELHTTELDWVALQRLKRLALAEERNGGWGITKEGRRRLWTADGKRLKPPSKRLEAA
jgi:hypothetical protein